MLNNMYFTTERSWTDNFKLRTDWFGYRTYGISRPFFVYPTWSSLKTYKLSY